MTKSHWLILSAAVAVSVGGAQAQQGARPFTSAKPAAQAQSTAKGPEIAIWRSATCGCCGKWVEHLQAAGFRTTVHIVQNTDEAPAAKGVPRELRSCHTATVNGYTVEGHVPADVIQKMLKEKPKVTGIAVPGMPAGSPGMESPNPVAYDIVAWDASGTTTVYARKDPRQKK
jgi:hypothetical protein